MATDTQREKRRLILRAAITVFARSGYHTSRVSDVAKEAGVAYGLVYHYFGSKEDLLETIFRRTWTRMLEAVEEVERSEVTAREQIAGVARIVLGSWEARPGSRPRPRARGRAQPAARPVRSTRSSTRSQRSSGSSSGARNGASCEPDLDPRFAAWILYGALEEILTGWVFERLPARPDEVARAEQTVIALLTDGLAVD